jgi:hypothetical protein
MSRDTTVDDSRCALPAEPNPAHRGVITRALLTEPTPYECSGMTLSGVGGSPQEAIAARLVLGNAYRLWRRSWFVPAQASSVTVKTP